MAYFPIKDRSIRERKFRSKEINFGIHTNDSAWVIDDQEMSDGSCVTFNIKSGFKSQRGQVIQNYDSTQLGSYVYCRGGYYWKDYILVAFSDNTASTKIFALKDGVYTQLLGINNSFNKDNEVSFAGYEDKVYFADGEHVIRYWDGNLSNNIQNLTATGGSVPVGGKKIRIWRDRLWVMGTSTNANEVIASAIFDTSWWDTANGNSGGDKAFSILVDNNQDFPMLNIMPTLDTLGFYKGNGIYILVGTNENDWAIRQLPVDSGVIGANTVAKGVEAVFYDSDVGIKATRGTQSLEANARYDVVQSISISNSVKNLIDDLLQENRKNAFAVVYNDVYRCNYGSFVFRYNSLAKNGEGANELDKETEKDLACYIYDGINNRLFGVTKNTGDVYQLDVGHSVKRWKPIEMFNNKDNWTVTDCTASNDTTSGHYVYKQGVNFSVAGAQTATAVKTGLSLDLSSDTSDKIDFYVWVENNNFTSVTLRLGSSATDYYERVFNVSDFSGSFNNMSVLLSSFTTVGSPNIAGINRIELIMNTTNSCSFTFDLMRKATTGDYTKEIITKSYSFPPFDEYTKNFNEIRVWGKVNGSYLVNVDYYIDDSLTPSGTFTIDLSSRYFGYYLAVIGKGTNAGMGYFTDSSKSWNFDEWKDYYVYLRATNQYFQITGNTTDTLYIDGVGVLANIVGDTTDLGIWYQNDYCIVPAISSFYTEDLQTTDETASYGGGFDNVEFKETPYLRGKRIKLKFYTTEANKEFEIFGYQIVYEVLQHKP